MEIIMIIYLTHDWKSELKLRRPTTLLSIIRQRHDPFVVKKVLKAQKKQEIYFTQKTQIVKAAFQLRISTQKLYIRRIGLI